MDLCRVIMLQIADSPPLRDPVIIVEGRSKDEIDYHLHILLHEVYIEATEKTHKLGSRLIIFPKGLTWKGSDFVKAARGDTIWKKGMAWATAHATEFGKTLTTDLALTGCKMALGWDNG